MTTDPLQNLRCGILSIGRAGNDNQALGLAEAIGFESPALIPLNRTRWTGLLRVLSPLHSFNWKQPEPLPQILINVGWQTAPLAKALKVQHPELFVVQILKPGFDLNWADVVVSPRHDKLPALPHVVTTIGAPNRITPALLNPAGEQLRTQLGKEHKAPYLAVLVGGPSKRFKLDEHAIEQLVADIEQHAQQHKLTPLITTSRRTPAAVVAQLRAKGYWVWAPGNAGDNPYFGLLDSADHIMVTADSISMVSEACRTEKPVYVWGRDRLQSKKFSPFFAALNNLQRIADVGSADNFAELIQPLSDTEQAAGFARALLVKRFNLLSENFSA